MKHFDRLLSKLESVHQQGNRYRARCPSHEDENPSLDIIVQHDRHIRLRCQSAGCSTTMILQALCLTHNDLWPDPDEEMLFAQDPTLFGSTLVNSEITGSELSDSDIELRSAIYNKFLEHLVLFDQHRNDLRERGLENAHIDERGYRSLTFRNRTPQPL